MELEETSMSFDLENVEPFLVTVAARLDSGFSAEDAAKLAGEIAALPVDGELTRHYTVTFQGGEMPLKVEIFMDDVEAPDLYLFAPESLVEAIEEEMDAYFD
jgi:hypothetical protein